MKKRCLIRNEENFKQDIALRDVCPFGCWRALNSWDTVIPFGCKGLIYTDKVAAVRAMRYSSTHIDLDTIWVSDVSFKF
jgi:hypothetical protein